MDKTYPLYIGEYKNPSEGSRTKPTKVQWNERGIFNTAHILRKKQKHAKHSKKLWKELMFLGNDGSSDC